MNREDDLIPNHPKKKNRTADCQRIPKDFKIDDKHQFVGVYPHEKYRQTHQVPPKYCAFLLNLLLSRH